MKTTQKQKALDLKKLENILTKNLAKKSLDIGNIIVNCLDNENKVTILIQHSPPVSPSPQNIFTLLKNILSQQTFHNLYQFELCLTIYGEQPYIRENFTNILHTNQAIPPTRNKQKIQSKNRYFILLFGGSFFILTIIYSLTRPCVIGKCNSIIKAQQLADNSQQLIQQEDLLEAENQLNIAFKLLKSIPWFSSYYSESQQIISQYQRTLDNLKIILFIIQTANQAIINSQKNTLSLEELQSIQTTLEEAIKTLNAIAQTQEFINIAHNTQEIYQLELDRIRNTYNQEIQGENDILTATEIAEINLLRQEQGKSLEDWQLINTTWQLVINRLKSINPDNIFYPQARELLTKYHAKIKEAENKLTQEKNAYQTYQEALKLAQQAQILLNQQQYTLAIDTLNKALQKLININQNTSIFNEAQKLINQYQTSLRNTEQELKFSQNRQQANQDLDKICNNQEKICSYNLETNNIIKVYLNHQYLQKVFQIAITNQAQGDLLQHISSVQKALETVSNKYKIPLEVYHSDGGLLFSYAPN
jgi:tetratricopeptide (TPR) repeat protein